MNQQTPVRLDATPPQPHLGILRLVVTPEVGGYRIEGNITTGDGQVRWQDSAVCSTYHQVIGRLGVLCRGAGAYMPSRGLEYPRP
jgi:hypothetical protein